MLDALQADLDLHDQTPPRRLKIATLEGVGQLRLLLFIYSLTLRALRFPRDRHREAHYLQRGR